jgi:hypothetical protein
MSLLYTWGLAKEALPFLRYTAERYPASVQAQAILADGYVLLENYPAAIDILSKFVAQHPATSVCVPVWNRCVPCRTARANNTRIRVMRG